MGLLGAKWEELMSVKPTKNDRMCVNLAAWHWRMLQSERVYCPHSCTSPSNWLFLTMQHVLALQGRRLYTHMSYVMASAASIVSWRFAVRTIERANSILDFTSLEKEFQELTVVQTVGVDTAQCYVCSFMKQNQWKDGATLSSVAFILHDLMFYLNESAFVLYLGCFEN